MRVGLPKIGFKAGLFLMAGLVPAFAQSPPPTAGSRDPYITSTGETVDKPGQSQSGGTTPLDRKIQRENDKIDGSICRGC